MTLPTIDTNYFTTGRLKLSRLGGIQWTSFETEGVWIFTSKDEKVCIAAVRHEIIRSRFIQ